MSRSRANATDGRTLHRVLEALIDEGVLLARQGRSTFVVGQPDNQLQALREESCKFKSSSPTSTSMHDGNCFMALPV
jgi:DNA-binding GntR family transcriptional regulator